MANLPFLSTFSPSGCLAIYRVQRLQALLLEKLANRQFVATGVLLEQVIKQMHKEIKSGIQTDEVNEAINYMTLIGMLKARDHQISITDEGMEALKDCRYQQMATTAYYNYLNLSNTVIALIFSVFSFFIAIVALVINSLAGHH